MQKGHGGDSPKSKRKNKNKVLPEGEPVRILGNTSTEGFGEETLRTWQCNIDCTREDGRSQTKLTCQEHVPERIVEQIIEVQVPLPILEETVSVMKLAPHEHAQMTQKTAEFLQPQFIYKVGDNRVKLKRQVPQSKWR